LKKFFLFLFLIVCISPFTFSQADSCSLRISLLTCAPGEELYSSFGHTALRVQNLQTGDDEVFNYGTFEFDDDFYAKFIRGKLLYFLSVESFDDFMYQYRIESRSVQEQVLQLSCDEKQKLLNALGENAQEDKKYYRYDFLFDNCTTRAGDIVAKNTDSAVVFTNILPKDPPSFRDMIHEYLDAGHEDWSKLGIDILLGAKLDRKATNKEAIFFLPDYLLKGFDQATVHGHRLAAAPQTILDMPSPLNKKSFFTPTVIFTLLLLLVASLAMFKSRWALMALSIFDFLFFFLLGMAGVLLLFMWFGTDHKVCSNNYNLLWALPTNLVMAFFVHSKRSWVKTYFRIIFWFSILVALAWFVLPQAMNNALIPVLLLILFRSRAICKTSEDARKTDRT
jgi:hypothetical protein